MANVTAPAAVANVKKATTSLKAYLRRLILAMLDLSLNGRLNAYQKQNRHVSFGVSVIKPPRVGPRTPAIPYTLVTRAIPNGLALSGTDCPKMAKLPHSSPAAPAPEMALPIISAAEFGEAAQRMEPPSTEVSVSDCDRFIAISRILTNEDGD